MAACMAFLQMEEYYYTVQTDVKAYHNNSSFSNRGGEFNQ